MIAVSCLLFCCLLYKGMKPLINMIKITWLFCEFHACLQHVEVPVPTPKTDEVLLKVEAVSLNPFDWKVQKGMLRPLLPRKFPHIPGKSVLPLLPTTLTSVLMVDAF